MSYTQIIYHIVFSTKHRHPCLSSERREDLFRYTWGIIKNHQCHLYRINGVEDHLHILTSLHPTVCLADLVKAIKTGTSKWVKQNNVFADFDHWQDNYGAFTLSCREKEGRIEYIKNQAEHHKKVSYRDEFCELLEEAGIDYDEKYLL
jgi:putative transposase